jgi:hypothetical protein
MPGMNLPVDAAEVRVLLHRGRYRSSVARF